MQGFDVLPQDFRNVVLEFAYNMHYDHVLESVNTILDIKAMDVPFFFFRDKVWSWTFKKYCRNPIYTYLPVELIGGSYSDLFDEDSMFCLLLGLDFRRRNVRLLGSRRDWLNRIYASWRAVEPLAAFYKMLLRCNTPIMKKNRFFVL